MQMLTGIMFFIYFCVQETYSTPLRLKRYTEFTISCRQHNDFTWECICPQRNVILTLSNSEDAYFICGIDFNLSLISKTPHFIAKQKQLASDIDSISRQERPHKNFWEDDNFSPPVLYDKFKKPNAYEEEHYNENNGYNRRHPGENGNSPDFRQYDVPSEYQSENRYQNSFDDKRFPKNHLSKVRNGMLLTTSTTSGGMISQEKLDRNLQQALSRFQYNINKQDERPLSESPGDQQKNINGESNNEKYDKKQINDVQTQQVTDGNNFVPEETNQVFSKDDRDDHSKQETSYASQDDTLSHTYIHQNSRPVVDLANKQVSLSDRKFEPMTDRTKSSTAEIFNKHVFVKTTFRSPTKGSTSYQPYKIPVVDEGALSPSQATTLSKTLNDIKPIFSQVTSSSIIPEGHEKTTRIQDQPTMANGKEPTPTTDSQGTTLYYKSKERLFTKAQKQTTLTAPDNKNPMKDKNDQMNNKTKSRTDVIEQVNSKNDVPFLPADRVDGQTGDDKDSINKFGATMNVELKDVNDLGKDVTASVTKNKTVDTGDEQNGDTSGCYFYGQMIAVGESTPISYSCKMICVKSNMMKRDCSGTKTLDTVDDPNNALMNWHS